MADYFSINEKLVALQLIHIDPETSEVFIDGWFKDNPPMNEKHRKGTLKEIERISSPILQIAATEALDEEWAKYIRRQDVRVRKVAGYELNSAGRR